MKNWRNVSLEKKITWLMWNLIAIDNLEIPQSVFCYLGSIDQSMNYQDGEIVDVNHVIR